MTRVLHHVLQSLIHVLMLALLAVISMVWLQIIHQIVQMNMLNHVHQALIVMMRPHVLQVLATTFHKVHQAVSNQPSYHAHAWINNTSMQRL